MKEFSCGGVVPGCDARFTAEDEDGIFAQVAEHAAEAHGLTEIPPEVAAQVSSLIREVPAAS